MLAPRNPRLAAAAARVADLQQEGEAGVAVGHVLAAPVLRVHQAHDDLPQHREAHVDAARLLQALARGTGLPLPLRACARHRYMSSRLLAYEWRAGSPTSLELRP